MDDTTTPYLKETNSKLWLCIDGVVLQWIYETKSDDFLNTNIKRDSTIELS